MEGEAVGGIHVWHDIRCVGVWVVGDIFELSDKSCVAFLPTVLM